MKQESSPVFDRVVQEVARIIFGDHNLTELNVRLGRMALERHNVHEIVKQPPAARTEAIEPLAAISPTSHTLLLSRPGLP